MLGYWPVEFLSRADVPADIQLVYLQSTHGTSTWQIPAC